MPIPLEEASRDVYVGESQGEYFAKPLGEMTREELIVACAEGWRCYHQQIKDSMRGTDILCSLLKRRGR